MAAARIGELADGGHVATLPPMPFHLDAFGLRQTVRTENSGHYLWAYTRFSGRRSLRAYLMPIRHFSRSGLGGQTTSKMPRELKPVATPMAATYALT